MAGGEGGFSTKAMGFDKKEVNDYIANLNQRMKEIEAEKKTNDEKTQSALKKASEADTKIKALKNECDRKIADLELQLKTERKNEEDLLIQIDDLKRKLKQKASAPAPSKAGSADADKKASEIIAKANAAAKDIVDKANATARDTVEKAKSAAAGIVSGAQGAGGNAEGLDEFIRAFNGFMDTLKKGAGDLSRKAEELAGAQGSTSVDIPDFSDIVAPSAKAPVASVPVTETVPSKKARDLSEDLFAALEESDEDMDDSLDMITEVQPLDDPSNTPTAVVLEEFDLSNTVGAMDEFDEPVTEVEPIAKKKQGNQELSDEFERQILAQTANSSMLKDDVDEDLLAAVKQQEDLFAVQPSDDVSDFDMEQPAEEEDPLAAMLKQAELTFGTATGDKLEEEEPEPEPEIAPEEPAPADTNPWAALQNELFAMEKAGDFGEPETKTAKGKAASVDPVVPNADDSAIWDFGSTDMSESGDDMEMSSDLFGGF